MQQRGLSVRDRIKGNLGFMSTAAALAKLTAERDGRVIRQVVKREAVAVGGGRGGE
jgi:threonyl-tRNA synthetase